MGSTQHLFDRFYSSKPGFVDGTTEFHRLCANELPNGGSLLEIGAGPANATTRFLATIGRVTGLDISDEVRENPALSQALTFDGARFPIEDNAVDGVVSNYVLEHVSDPVGHFAEVFRVLRPGGRYVFRTPNLLHYVATISRLLPHKLHVTGSKRLRGMTQADHDPYPTFYRANSRGAIRRLADRCGLRVRLIRMVEKEPSYGRVSPLVFYPMMLYERVVNASEAGAPFRSNIFGVFEKATPSARA